MAANANEDLSVAGAPQHGARSVPMPGTPELKPVRAPLAPLTAYFGTEAERAGFVRDLFDRTAGDYDRIERVLALGSGSWYRRQALERAGLGPGMDVLDVGFGTGLLAAQAIRLTGAPERLIGLDPSVGMMGASPLTGVRLLEGRAEQIPLPDASVDFVSMGYALRHLSDLGAACAEFHRVLRPGGRLCLLEITRPRSAWAAALLRGYMRGWVPLAAWLTRSARETPQLWRYYWDSIEACVPPERILDTLRAVGFQDVGRHVELGCCSEYQARKPA